MSERIILADLDEKTRALLMVAWFMGYRGLRQDRSRWYVPLSYADHPEQAV